MSDLPLPDTPVGSGSPASSRDVTPAESPAVSPTPEEQENTVATTEELNIPDEHRCALCSERYKSPRVLSCLHVFCTPCLKKQLEEDCPGDPDSTTGTITCSECKQVTPVAQDVSELHLDIVLENALNMAAITDMQVVCTSCKAREKAVARCTDCANFLCPNCVTAHQYMRCFENHKVVSFEELQNGDGTALHKPLFCETHTSESLKFFCETCQIPVCSDCVLADHHQPEHVTERLVDAETKQLQEIRALVTESKGKIAACEEVSSSLESTLNELQMQRDNARGLIEETFQTYRTMLEKKKDDTLAELEELHKMQELHIMDLFHAVEKVTEKIEDGCQFAEHVLEAGSLTEVLLMKKPIVSQLLSLINNMPKHDLNVNIDFLTDADKFQEAINASFGGFKKQDEVKPGTPVTSLHSSFENEGFALPSGVLNPEAAVLPPVTGTDFIANPLPPLSIPNMVSLPMTGVSAHTINSIASSMQNLNSDRSSSRNSYSPAMSDSGISVDAASTNSANNTPLANNLAALAKLGPISVNTQGQITVKGPTIPGLNVGNVNMPPPAAPGTGRVQTPTNTTPDAALASLLGSINLTPGNPILGGAGGARSPTPVGNSLGSLPDIANLSNLLTQQSGQLNGMSGLGAEAGLPLNGNLNLSTPPPATPTFSGATPMAFPARASGKMSAMQIRCKFGQLGPGKGQFNSPHGFCLGMEEDIIVADTNNHRVQVFEKTGEFKYQFGIPGREEGQLWYPRKVAVMRHSGKYVVCDRGNERSRMQIFTKNGHFIKKIAIRYIDIVAGLAITQQGHIVAVDSVSPTVFCIAETGDLLKWFDCSDYMREPSDIAINNKEYFVCDFKGHCVVVFNEDGQFLRRIGCENITNFPNGIDISDAGDVLVGDSHGNRFHVAVFQRDGSLIGEFECPYVKVSRCCGLKITSEGYVVTLAKNNHHVLVLNTLYIT